MNSASQITQTPGDAPAAEALPKALRRLFVDGVGEMLGNVFESADDFLFHMADRAKTNEDQQNAMDTLRLLRLKRDIIAGHFNDMIADAYGDPGHDAVALDGGAVDEADELSMMDLGCVEKNIAAENLIRKIENVCADSLRDLGLRIRHWNAQHPGHQLPEQPVSPGLVARAFQNSMAHIDISLELELIVYKLFDRAVVEPLDALYVRANEALSQRGAKAQHSGAVGQQRSNAQTHAASNPDKSSPGADKHALETVADDAPPGRAVHSADFQATQQWDLGDLSGPGARGEAAHTAPATSGVAWRASPRTLQALREHAANLSGRSNAGAPGHTQANTEFSQRLLRVLDGGDVESWPDAHPADIQRRSAVAMDAFEDIAHSRLIPRKTREALEALRIAVMQAAVADKAFFRDESHPMRRILDDVVELGAISRLGGRDIQAQIADLMDDLIAQVNAHNPVPLGPDPERLEEQDVEGFSQARQRWVSHLRKSMVQRAKAMVAQKWSLISKARAVSPALQRLAEEAWIPVMAVHLINHGKDSLRWRGGVELMEEILDFPLGSRAANEGLVGDAEHETQILSRFRLFCEDVDMARERTDSQVFQLANILFRRRKVKLSDAQEQDEQGLKRDADRVRQIPSADTRESQVGATAPQQTAYELLDQLIVADQWFRVFQAEQGVARWLKAVCYYRELGQIAFAEFNMKNTVMIKDNQFLHDLHAGRSEVLDPAPATQSLLERLKLQFNAMGDAADLSSRAA